MLPQLQELLTDLVQTPALVCTVSRDGVVSELFLEKTPQKVEFADSWVTIECEGWHIHADLSTVVRVRFEEVPGHDGSISPLVSLDDEQGSAVLRFYFPHASQTYKTWTEEELALFGQFKKQYEETLGAGPMNTNP